MATQIIFRVVPESFHWKVQPGKFPHLNKKPFLIFVMVPHVLNLDLKLYPPDLFVAERELSAFLSRLLVVRPQQVDPIVDGLVHKQPQAVINACTKPISILTGPPGTGKTTTLRQIVNSFKASGLRILVIALTGKAAKRAYEVVNAGVSFVNIVPSQTVHSAVQYDPVCGSFQYNRFF